MPPTPQPGQRHEISLPLPGGSEISMPFRYIPPGRFRMGSRGMGERDPSFRNEEPVHWVEITRGFWMAETPVTQKQFGAWTRTVDHREWKPSVPALAVGYEHHEPHLNHFEGNPDHPAESLSWYEADGFCRWMSLSAESFPPGFSEPNLPTEAQWEHACRGPDLPEQGAFGHHCDYHTGDGETSLLLTGWCEENSGDRTHPVRQLAPNAWWLYDLHGNVAEWCRDEWSENVYASREDGMANPFSSPSRNSTIPPDRALRGGSWGEGALVCRSASRIHDRPSYCMWDRGFRPILETG